LDQNNSHPLQRGSPAAATWLNIANASEVWRMLALAALQISLEKLYQLQIWERRVREQCSRAIFTRPFASTANLAGPPTGLVRPICSWDNKTAARSPQSA
jgi:hypothetical protein